mgnify:CR=1 FL=1
MISKKMENMVANSSAIRAMFEEGNRLAKIYGPENVFDFSLGNPNVPAPKAVKQAIDSKPVKTVEQTVDKLVKAGKFAAAEAAKAVEKYRAADPEKKPAAKPETKSEAKSEAKPETKTKKSTGMSELGEELQRKFETEER